MYSGRVLAAVAQGSNLTSSPLLYVTPFVSLSAIMSNKIKKGPSNNNYERLYILFLSYAGTHLC